MFLYIQFFGLMDLTQLEPSTSLTDALCSSDKHSRSTSVLSLSLAYWFTHMLPRLSPQDWILSCRLMSYIRLIARLETSVWHFIIFLKHSLCCSYTSVNVWCWIFYLFLACDSSHHDVTGLAGHRSLGATVLCYNTLPVLFSYTVPLQQPISSPCIQNPWTSEQ